MPGKRGKETENKRGAEPPHIHTENTENKNQQGGRIKSGGIPECFWLQDTQNPERCKECPFRKPGSGIIRKDRLSVLLEKIEAVNRAEESLEAAPCTTNITSSGSQGSGGRG